MTHRRRIFLVALALFGPMILVIVLPASIALALQIPAALVVQKTGLAGTPAVIIALLIDWLLLASMVGGFSYLLIAAKNRTAKVVVVGIAFLSLVCFIAIRRPQHNRTYSGIYEYGFERSAFYPNGQCWRPAYWVEAMPLYDLPRDSAAAVSVKFVGDASAIGGYGHLGTYVREVRVIKVLEAEPARPCR